ncbi:MAG: transcription-repair coupling factor, partial [Flavobacteriales bacterium]|nr:transcription-repair coupling factor [Flavobacteriales bacterium]
MNIPELKSLFSQSKNTQVLLETLQENELSHIQLKGLMGSSPAFFSQALFQQFPINQLFILNDKEEAAYFLNDLEHIVGEDKVLFFPPSYKRAYQIEETDNSNILLRAEVLNSLSKKSSSKIIVTYPDALAEK